jgi:flagellar basal-body rod modification protein FlgD
MVPILGAVVPSVIGAVKDAFTSKPAATAAPSPTLGKDDFLKLLVAQLRHQDPLNPLQNDQFIAQTATFSSLEELQRIRSAVETNPAQAAAGSMASATSFIGRSVTAASAGFTYAGATVSLPFTLDRAATGVAVEVLDGRGTVVSRVALGNRPAGTQSLDFMPGVTGPVLPAGAYRYRIVAQSATGAALTLSAIGGVVSAVGMDGGAPVLMLDGRRIALADVVSVASAPAPK